MTLRSACLIAAVLGAIGCGGPTLAADADLQLLHPAPEIAAGGTVVLRGTAAPTRPSNALEPAVAVPSRAEPNAAPAPVFPPAGSNPTGFDRRFDTTGINRQFDNTYDRTGFDRNFDRTGLSR